MDTIALPDVFIQAFGRLLLAAVLGAAIGANRELRQKPAGLRTHALVALGAALASLTSLYLRATPGLEDPAASSRVLQGILAGVGFIGAGVILHRSDTKVVHGLTTAASIWVVSTVGAAAGLGLWRLALISVALVLLVFAIGGPLDRALHRLRASERAREDEE